MSLDSYRALLAEFGGAIGLDALAPDDEGYCALEFDDLPVHLQYDAEADEVVAFARLGEADEDRLETVYGMLLGANLFWQGTKGATLSVEPDSQAVFIADRRGAGQSGPAFQAWLGAFVEVADYWRGRLARVNEGAPASEDDADLPGGDAPGADFLVKA